MTLKKIHSFSGILLAFFIGIHLKNHLSALWGIETHTAFMEILRAVYRNPFVEFFLLSSVVIQIVSGPVLIFRRLKSEEIPVDLLQIASGLYLAFFLTIHVSAVMTGRFFLHLDTNFYFGAAGINRFPFNLFFIPYYSLAVLSVFAHVASIHRQKRKADVFGLSPRSQANLILILGCFTLCLLMFALTDGFRGVEIPAAYRVLTGGK
ncbi:hypothetical protein EHQ12_01885 [Leptospira gomenensis]|uniref:Uncharacterized protein n=1 Tax=Leptospira gomenensis TaxID=2484974 RepID=A0A5F1YGL4_9LEPT|nr:hypothetical protein [Leptospira gomenensis]TGK39351.1 hypothetical protein EHQ17_00080 [Leptospira gomenensis]TGK44089.1 hypothetical protein EHQ07_12435 [Leptospira gomenensis]TGK44292.1 hypothetical protein EHQ12_01885 [Leptospira gomenensis]TGK65863.1 hypothetical protein EHQ13_04540 [Leptospira gomenensis]